MFSGHMLQVCLSGCCICFIACVLSGCCICLQWFSSVFRCFFQVFQKHVPSVLSAFRRMLQLLHLDASKANRMLHLSSSPSAASSRCVLLPVLVGHLYDAAGRSSRIGGTLLLLLSLGRRGPRMEHVKRSVARTGRPGASTAIIKIVTWSLCISLLLSCCYFLFSI
jgi:hypothetical protein